MSAPRKKSPAKSRGTTSRRKGTSASARRAPVRAAGHRGTHLLWVVLLLASLAVPLHFYGVRHSAEYRRRVAPQVERGWHYLEQTGRTFWDWLAQDREYPALCIADAAAAQASPYDNLKLGAPSYPDVVIDRRGYALGYSVAAKQSLWVSYKLTATEVRSKRAKRTDDFRPDPMLGADSATLEDYRKSAFDRGHMAPAADMAFAQQAMSESFYLSNMSPQYPGLNRGIWKDLEERVRDYAIANEELYVVTGPIFYRNEPVITVGAGRIRVPSAYFKVVYDASPPSHKAIGYVIPNRESNFRALDDYVVSVDTVENLTGLDFFAVLDDAQERAVEGRGDAAAWR